MALFAVSPALRSHTSRYGEVHRTPANVALHFAGIPALLVSFLGLLSKAPLSDGEVLSGARPDAAWLVLLSAGLWYVWQDPRAGVLIDAVLVGCYAIGSVLSLGPLAALFGVGVIAHVIGHYGFEHKSPALLSRPVAVLEAPAWLTLKLIGLYR